MLPSSRTSCGGFTYLAALFIIMIMGIMLGMVGQSWTALMKREKEEELLFRGNQILNAIATYYTATKNGAGLPRGRVHALSDLKDLLKDKGELTTTRYISQIYIDPITGKDWNVITGPVKIGNVTFPKGVIGVASTSDAEPLRQKNFADHFGIPKNSTDPVKKILKTTYDTFDDKKKYSEWQFVYGQAAATPTTPGTLNTTPTPLTPFPGQPSTGSGTGQTPPVRQPEQDSTIWNRRNSSGW